ncbi:MAG: type II toxin-antitoxin system RelE/ParE family toxin, partial [bacterium]
GSSGVSSIGLISSSSSPRWGTCTEPRKYPRVRILLYGHYRILYLPEQDGIIYILGVFHGAMELKRHFKPQGERP